ncbi:MAG: hypothetical protein RDA78_09540 [Roseibium sp.]|uniref:phasin family protein n=1 Tax=Roseibium sp. TaxID=1936156 RepID=UPI003D9C46F9
MATKRNPDVFDFTALKFEWPMPSFTNWAFAEREDRIEAKTVAGFQKMGTTMWSHAEKAFEEHMEFVSHRLHEDFECAKSLTQCVAPEQTLATLQDFYSKMATEYQEHFEQQASLFRDSFSQGAAAVEELNEAAMENVGELGKAAEETLEEMKPAKARSRGSSTAKTQK